MVINNNDRKGKMLSGMLYAANNDSALIAERMECKELCRD